MIYAQYNRADSEGVILAHTLRLDKTKLTKGTRLTAEHLVLLEKYNIDSVSGVRLTLADIDENTAAMKIAKKLAGKTLIVGKPLAGRCNLYAKVHGLTQIDKKRIDAINLSGGAITVATLPEMAEAYVDQAVATVKVIPFAVPESLVEHCLEYAGGETAAVDVMPFQRHNAALILTKSPALKDSVLKTTRDVTQRRVEALDSRITFHRDCGHNLDELSMALAEALKRGCNPIMICGANVTVDRADIVPSAIKGCDGEIIHFGMPVEPGNMLLLAKIGDTFIINMPGCSRSPKLNGFDWVLQRILAGIEVKPKDIMSLGVGGLIKDVAYSERKHKVAAQPKDHRKSRVAAIVLAAGRSQRMGEAHNKLLSPINGMAMAERVAKAALDSNVQSVNVVTGHESDQLNSILSSYDLNVVHNQNYKSGIASSVKCGIESLPSDVDGAIILLGDMPFVTVDLINELLSEFDPNIERDIVMPVMEGRRGNPVVIAQRYFSAIREIGGDTGASQIINEYPGNVWEVPVGNEAIFTDVDTKEELIKINELARVQNL